MTSLYLLLWITGGVLLQIAVYLSLGFWRHWQAYQALRTAAAEFDIAVDPAAATPEMAPTAVAAWPGYRSFHVERKVMEDQPRRSARFISCPRTGSRCRPSCPGQFLTFRLDVPAASGRHANRSSAAIPCPMRRSPITTGSRSSACPRPLAAPHPAGVRRTYFHDHVEVGSSLQVRAPAGHFHIDRSDAPVVLIGGGIGITPMLSMLNWCLAEQPGREVWLFYGVRNRPRAGDASASGRRWPRHIRTSICACASATRCRMTWPGRRRLFTATTAASMSPCCAAMLPLKPYHFYICGPTPMMESLVPALEDWGVPDARIHFEAFGPASIKRARTRPRRAGQQPRATTPARCRGDLRQVRQTAGLASPAWVSLLEFAEAQWHCGQFRLPGRWLRQLPDHASAPAKWPTASAGLRSGAGQLPALRLHAQDQRDPGGINDNLTLAPARICPLPCCSACWRRPPWPATICCTA